MMDKLSDLEERRKTTIRTIKSPTNESQILCQCMCDLGVSREDMLEAVQYIVNTRKTRSTTTTPVPTTVAQEPEFDDW